MDKKRILLIEDDTFTRELYEEVLKDANYQVDTAADGEAGLERLKVGGYAIVLLDVMMPKMDGLDVLRSLKNDPAKTPNGPIILLTNLTHDPIINMAYGLGVKTHLVKSDITPGELIENIQKYLEPTTATDSSDAQ